MENRNFFYFKIEQNALNTDRMGITGGKNGRKKESPIHS